MAKKKVSKKSSAKKKVKKGKEDLVFKEIDSSLKSRFFSQVQIDAVLRNIIWFGIGFVFFYLFYIFSTNILYQRFFLAITMILGFVTLALVLGFIVIFFLKILSNR